MTKKRGTAMNKAYRLVWSKAKEAWVVAAETVSGNGAAPPVTSVAAVAAAVLLLSVALAHALPTAPNVISGTAAITTSGSAMTVTNSANAIINWQGFSIGQGESTRFIQPSAASAVLNRITGGDPSKIFGALQSNGKVLLINPNGILFGAGARIDVNGLIASTLDITNQDFLAGRMKFSAGAAAGKVDNQGAISTPDGGSVYLLAPNVANSGVITAPNGDVMLAAGKEVLLVDKNNPEIAVVVSAPEHQAVNLGTLAADAGRIGMYGGIVRQKGLISADSAVKDASGRIFLKAAREITVESGSSTTADGIGSADGGKVVIKSDGTTVVDGDISARGGAQGGTGGFVETSGGYLVVNKAPDLTAPAAKAGTWLLDPYDIIIGSTDTPTTYAGSPNYVGSGGVSPSFIGAALIAGVLDGGTSVVVDTTGSGGGIGNITVATPINTANAGAATLTLKAHNDIVFNAAMTMNNQLVLTADQDVSGAGNVVFNQNVTAANISASGRDIIFASLDGGSTFGTLNGNAVSLTAANVITPSIYGAATEVSAQSLTLNAVNGIGIGGKVFVGNISGQISFTNSNNGVNIHNSTNASIRGFTGTNTNGPIRLESFESLFPTVLGNLTSGGDIVLRMNKLSTAGGASINAGSNTVYLSPYTVSPVPAVSINGSQAFNLTDADINRITSGKVIIGYDSFGNYTPNLSIGTSAAVNLSIPQPIELYGQSITTGTNTVSLAGGSLALIATGATSDIILDGAITKTAGADSALTLLAGRSIVTNQPVTSIANKLNVTLNAHYQNDSALGNVAVHNAISTNGGNLTVGGGTNPLLVAAKGYDATTAGADRQYGVNLDTISAPLIINTSGGSVSIRGEGVANSNFDSLGIYLGNAQLHAGGGNILLDGQAGDNPLSADNAGVYITDAIDTPGNGTITIQGRGGVNSDATKANRGINLTTAAAIIGSGNGSISLTGIGGLNTVSPTNPNNQGIRINGGGGIVSTNAPLFITGTAGNSGSVGIATSGASPININSPTAVTFKADKMDFAAPTSSLGGITSTVTVVPLTAGRPITLGSDTGNANADLELSTNELSRFVAATLRIGDNLSGALSVDAAIAPTGVANNLILGSGATVGQTGAGTISVANLGVKSLGSADLSAAPNMVTGSIAAGLGDGANVNSSFRFTNSGDINIGTVDGINGISAQTNGIYNTAAPDGVIALNSVSGNVTQSVGAVLASKAVQASGASVSLTEANPTGVISGVASGFFSYRSINGILVDTVNGIVGLTNNFIEGQIVLNSDQGIAQSAGAPISVSFGALNLSAKAPVTLLQATNSVGVLSVSSAGTGSVNFLNSTGLSVTGITTGNQAVTIATAAGDLSVDGDIFVGSANVGLLSFGNILQTAGVVTASGLAFNAGGAVTLKNANMVDAVAGSTSAGNIEIANAKSLAVGVVAGAGFAETGLTSPAAVILTLASGVISDSVTTGPAISAPSLDIMAQSGIGTLAAPLKSKVGSLSATTVSGGIYINNAMATVVSGLSAGGDIALDNSGALSLFGTLSGANINLRTDGAFSNTSGLLAATGRWLVWSADPSLDNRGGLSYDFKQYNAQYGISPVLGSGNGFLYSLAPTLGTSLTGTVTKTYDGTLAAVLTAGHYSGVSGVIDGDTVVLTNPTVGSFDTKNAGSGKTVTVNGISVAGATNGTAQVYGYSVAGSASGAIGDIGKKTLTVSASGNNKVYDGNTSATAVLADDRVAGDALTLSGAASFLDKNAASGKSVSVSGINLSGTDSGNYSLASTSAATTADIVAKALTVGVIASNKVYDGNTTASVVLTDDRIAGDVMTISSGSASFLDKNSATGKAVNVTGITIGGADVGNYSLSNTAATTTADISAKTLTVSATGNNKVYDGNTAAAVVLTDDRIAGDIMTVGGSASFSDRNAAGGKTVSVSGINLSGADAGNYSLSGTTASTTADISVRPQSTWTAGSGGFWSNPANWDALPDANNVLAVVIPSGGSYQVVYDVGTTTLQSLNSFQNLVLASGTLNIVTALGSTGLEQSGGTLNGTGSLNVSNRFNQSGGSINLTGAATLVQASGDLNIADLKASTVSLIAQNGRISQTGPISTSFLVTSSTAGTVLNSTNRIAAFSAANGATGNIELTNTAAPLNIAAITQSGAGDIIINNTGAIITGREPVSSGGSVSMTAHSPLTIGSGGVTAVGNITLVAAASDGIDNLTVNGPVASTSGGIVLKGGDKVIMGADGSAKAPSGSVTTTDQSGTSTVGGTADENIAGELAAPVVKELASIEFSPVATPGLMLVSLSTAHQGDGAPSMDTCVAAPNTPGCADVLPSLAACTANPSIPGCSAVLSNQQSPSGDNNDANLPPKQKFCN